MSIRTLRFIALVLAALALGMHLAHALELTPKQRWNAELYLVVQTSLYVWFGTIGPVFEVGALLAVSAVALRLRGRPAGLRFTLISALAIVVALGVWLLVVMQANAHITAWKAGGITPPDWMHWRDQWQYGQASIFFLHLIGFSSLVWSVLRETPSDAAA